MRQPDLKARSGCFIEGEIGEIGGIGFMGLIGIIGVIGEKGWRKI